MRVSRWAFIAALVAAMSPSQGRASHAASASPVGALSQSLVGYRPVPLENGFAHIVLAGQTLVVARAWRENYNAHGFSVFAFYADVSDGGKHQLLAVPLFGDASDPIGERETITTQEGADCMLGDIRLLAASEDARLVVASRALGKSYADPAPVHFDVYRFEKNRGGMPGFPPFDFRFERRIDAGKNYCDVGQAFRAELGLPD
jgi:hypothetical protein